MHVSLLQCYSEDWKAEYQMCLMGCEGALLIRLGLQLAFMPFLGSENS